MNRITHLGIVLVLFLMLTGFNLDNAIIPKDEILSGGPPKDGIPAIIRPLFLKPAAASFLSDEDPVIGVTIGSASRAYPIKILNWHEAVNDTLGGRPIAVNF